MTDTKETKPMEELLTVSFPDHQAATDLLKNHTGGEGGSPDIEWYSLRDEIAFALAKARHEERERCRQSHSAPPAVQSVKVTEAMVISAIKAWFHNADWADKGELPLWAEKQFSRDMRRALEAALALVSTAQGEEG